MTTRLIPIDERKLATQDDITCLQGQVSFLKFVTFFGLIAALLIGVVM